MDGNQGTASFAGIPQKSGSEFLVNSVAFGDQVLPTLAPLLDGGFVTTWLTMDFTNGNNYNVNARLFDADGTPRSIEFLVNVDPSSDIGLSNVAALSDGGFVVTWEVYGIVNGLSNAELKARSFDADGTPRGTEFLVNNEISGNQLDPTLAPLVDGGFVAAWATTVPFGDDSSLAVKARVFDANGTSRGAEFFLSGIYQYQRWGEVALVSLSDGGFVAAWRKPEIGNTSRDGDIIARSFDVDGTPRSAEFLINSDTNYDQKEITLATLPDGGFVAVWATGVGRFNSLWNIKARSFDADGTPRGADILVNSETFLANNEMPTLTTLPDGSFVVAWTTTDPLQDGDRWAIKARSFDADGTPRAAEFLVNSEIINIQVHPALTTLLDSSIVVAWATRDPLQDGIDGAIKAQIFSVTSDGANSPPVVSGNTLQTYSTLDSIPLANLFAPTDPDGRDDIVSIEISDDTPGTDGGEFGRSVFQVINGSAGWTWFPEPRIPGEPYQLTLTPAQLDDRSGPFGDYAWQYLPKTTGTNAIQIEATDSAGNVSNPLIINLNFTGATINTAPLLDLLASVSVTAGDTAIINVDATDDSDSEGSGLTYSLLASLDRNLFDIDPVSGQVSYIVPTGIADNADSNGDGIYELIAQVTDSDGLVDEKSFQIRVLKDASSASLEYLAKQVVYERNPANIVVLDNLSPEQAALRSDITEWEVEYEFIDAGGTFRAVALSKEGYAPVLAFRGTQIDDAGSPRFADGALADWAENFRSTGVGLDELNRGLDVVGTAGSQAADEPAPTLRAWILANDGLSITGHSQGGAQAQLATRFALKNDVQVAKLATFNSAGITLTQAVIDDLENTFFGTTVVHSINASDVVSLTGNAFVPGTVEYHDTDVANAFVIPNIFEGHTGYFVDDGLRTLLPFFAAPFSRSGLSLSDTQLSSGNYSPVLGYGQDWEYAGFMASVLALGGMIASAIALNPGAIQVSIGTTADSTPIIDLHASGTSLSAFLANDLLPALATREGLVNELAGANGDLVRNLLEAANQVIGAVNDGASVTINGQDVSTVLGGASAAVKAIPIADMTLNGLGLIAGSVVSIGETIQDGVLLLSSPMTNFLSGSRDGVAPTIVKDGTHANSTPAYVSNVAVNPEGEVLKSSAPGTFFALSDPSTTIEQTGGQNIVWGIPENYVDLRFVAPALGPDTFRSVAATASSGSPANAFTITDRIFVQGAAFTNADIEREKGSAILRIDFDGDGASDATVTMEGTYRLDSFVTEAAQDGTYIRYLGNAAPQVVADTATVSEDGIVLIAPLLNDLDIDGDTLAIVGLDLKGMQGTVIEDDDGTLIYDPNGAFDSLLDGETATDRFVYLVSDGTETVSSEVIITITGEGLLEPVRNPILGTVGSDNLVGTEGADAIRSLGGSYDKMLGGAAADQFIFGAEANNGIRERDVILDYEVGIDEIILRDGASVETIRVTSSQVVVFLNGDRDSIYVRGDGLTADNLTIITEDVFEFV